ncbi:MAG: UDP-N-acetylglucosamine 2-epimerase (non-hydrolyzing) [Pirellulales bacterium]
MTALRALLIMGTRPEAIKMAPIVHDAQGRPEQIEPIICFTGQHRQMLAQVAEYFQIVPDVNLKIMQVNQTLANMTSKCLEGLDAVVERFAPECLVAQGDTTTVMAASLVAFYRHLPFVHVEAGLRTGNLQSPWPEELNRRVAGLTSALHCAPTQRAANALLAEGTSPSSVYVTGNTVVDSLLWTVVRERCRHDEWANKFPMVVNSKSVLITGHRRENFGDKFESMCRAIRQLALSHPETNFIYPVHLNPNVREPVYRLLDQLANVHLLEPVTYPAFVWLMDQASLILTDSGGVQEEAPTLRKQVLVMRDTTERPEAIESGFAQLVGTSEDRIVTAASKILDEGQIQRTPEPCKNPYGDGQAASRIVDLMLNRAWSARRLPLAGAA